MPSLMLSRNSTTLKSSRTRSKRHLRRSRWVSFLRSNTRRPSTRWNTTCPARKRWYRKRLTGTSVRHGLQHKSFSLGAVVAISWRNKDGHHTFYLLEVFGDLRIVEVVHLVHHTDGRIDDRESTEGTCSLA